MDILESALKFLQLGTPAGLAVAIVIVVGGFWLKKYGAVAIMAPDKKVVSEASIAAVHDRLGGIEDRLVKVESDVKDSATRTELHELELAMTRFEGRMIGIEMTSRATAAGVTRIEDFMFAASERAAAGRRKD